MKLGKIITNDWFETVCVFLIPFILGVIIGDSSNSFHKPSVEDCAPICAEEFNKYGC